MVKVQNNKYRPCSDCPMKETTGKKVSKIGMIASLGVITASGILKFKGAKPLHIWASVAFAGFTLMHCAVNKPHKKKTG